MRLIVRLGLTEGRKAVAIIKNTEIIIGVEYVAMRVLVRGVNDIGSAVAHRLAPTGYAVVIHDTPYPPTSRRTMAFTDAVFDGHAHLAGRDACRVDEAHSLLALLHAHTAIPVFVGALADALAAVRPDVLVDARMRKRAIPEGQRDLAPLTIGLGPNVVAGETTHLAVETAWGDRLGAVLTRGATQPLAGDPRPIEGHTRDRFIYAPAAGVFHTSRHIGDMVAQGEIVAHLDTLPLAAPLSGALRGLTHDGVPVAIGIKVIEVDVRGPVGITYGIGERPGRIADGVERAIAAWQQREG